MSDLTDIKEVLQQCASVPISLLDGIGYDGECDLVADVLFPVLGWDSDNNYQTPADGQFMEYMEWKEPYLDFDKFALINSVALPLKMSFWSIMPKYVAMTMMKMILMVLTLT